MPEQFCRRGLGLTACVLATGLTLLAGCGTVLPPGEGDPPTVAEGAQPAEGPPAAAPRTGRTGFRITETSNQAQRLATAPLHAAGLPAIADLHDLRRQVIARADLSLAVRHAHLVTDRGRFIVRLHALMAGEDGDIPSPKTSARVRWADDSNALPGAGPVTVWQDDRLILYALTLGSWVIVPGAGDRPLLLVQLEEIGRRTTAVTVFAASRTGNTDDLDVYGAAWLAAESADQRFRLARSDRLVGGLPLFDVQAAVGDQDDAMPWGHLAFNPQQQRYDAVKNGVRPAPTPSNEPEECGHVSMQWPAESSGVSRGADN